jgi:hypothetical protein
MLLSQLLPAIQAAAFSWDCEQAISWVKTNHPAPGTYRQLALPGQFHRLSDTGVVDAVVLADGRIILFLKYAAGEREQRSGLIWSSAPLKASEIGPDTRGRDRIRIAGVQDHHITEKIDDRHYRVVLDPN